MQALILEIEKIAIDSLKKAYPHISSLPSTLSLSNTNKPGFGDFQINAPLQLSKIIGENPKIIATHIVSALKNHPALEKIEIAGPGFVNLFLHHKTIVQILKSLEENPKLNIRPLYNEETVVIDFSGPNIAKPFHVGHVRSTFLGDALQRIFREVGYQVVSDNHLGDWGTQFGKLIVAYRKWVNPASYAQSPIQELARLYQKFNTEEKQLSAGFEKNSSLLSQKEEEEDEDITPNTSSSLLEEARFELLQLQKGEPKNLDLWKEFVRISIEEFKKIYQRLGIHFDVWLGESFYHASLASLTHMLLEKKIAEYSQGMVVCPIDDEPVPLIIRKSDGAFLYGTTDLATLSYRKKTWNPSRILYVVGFSQQLHFRQVFKVARKMDIICSLEHVAFGMMKFKDPVTGLFVTGSTRKGNAPGLKELIQIAIDKAKLVLLEKNPKLPNQEIQKISEIVGIGALKYNNLNRDYSLDINFDIDLALSMDGNTAPYIQYAYARAKSILRKANYPQEKVLEHKNHIEVHLIAERQLARKILDYALVVEQVSQSLKIHVLCDYLYQLAGFMNVFYQEVPVLNAEEIAKQYRLRLLFLATRTLKHGLFLLGIECLEVM